MASVLQTLDTFQNATFVGNKIRNSRVANSFILYKLYTIVGPFETTCFRFVSDDVQNENDVTTCY